MSAVWGGGVWGVPRLKQAIGAAGRIAGLLDYQQGLISLQDLINRNQTESLKNLITNIRVDRLQFGAVLSLQSGSH